MTWQKPFEHHNWGLFRKARGSQLVIVAIVLAAAFLPTGPLRPRTVSATVPRSARQPARYAIVVTGGELLSGDYPDGHTYFLTRTLRLLGWHCVSSIFVDDKQDDIKQALRFATRKADLVIVTGGLGPTDNDITRQTLSDFTGMALREHPDVLQEMERRFKVPRNQLHRTQRRQTQVPTRGTYLKNPNGTAVGLVFELKDTVIVALPGPPRELQPMVRDELMPYLNRQFGTRLPGCSLMLRFVGIGQSRIHQILKDHVPLPPNVALTSQFKSRRVDFIFSFPDDTPQLRAQLQKLKRKILQQLGDYVYAVGETSLEEHVLKLLESRNATLAIVEVDSGGSLAAGFIGTAGAKRVLAGASVAPTEEKLWRLLRVSAEDWSAATSSAQRTKLLTTAAADLTGSQYVFAIGEAQQDQAGTRHVEVVFKRPEGPLENQQFRLRGTDKRPSSSLTTQLLDHLRRKLR